jgi:hypothetical protein
MKLIWGIEGWQKSGRRNTKSCLQPRLQVLRRQGSLIHLAHLMMTFYFDNSTGGKL